MQRAVILGLRLVSRTDVPRRISPLQNIISHQITKRNLSTSFKSSNPRFASLNMNSVSASEDKSLAKTVKYEDFIITDACVKHLHAVMKQHGPGTILRLIVDTGGCSGYQYLFNLEQVTPADKHSRNWKEGSVPQVYVDGEDIIFQRDGVTVIVDDVSYPFIKGSKIDYKSEMIRSAFAVIDNPNVDLACGCGTSFAKKAK